MIAFGAHVDFDGVTFAFYSSVVIVVDFVFERRYVEMEPQEGFVWMVWVDGVGYGFEYGFCVYGFGCCNLCKLLLDLYVRAIFGAVMWDLVVLDFVVDLVFYVLCLVVHVWDFDWGEDCYFGTAFVDLVIYVLYVVGIEVIFDVVFNYIVDVGVDGLMLCLCGIDDVVYYCLDADGGYVDDIGCGNMFDMYRMFVLWFVMDLLRYWCEDMCVDGFCFDFVVLFGCGASDFDLYVAFLEVIV